MLEVVIGIVSIILMPYVQRRSDNWERGRVDRDRIKRHILKAKSRSIKLKLNGK